MNRRLFNTIVAVGPYSAGAIAPPARREEAEELGCPPYASLHLPYQSLPFASRTPGAS